MNLHPVVKELCDIIAELPPKGAPLPELRGFHLAKMKSAELKAGLMPQALRVEVIGHVKAYIRNKSMSEDQYRNLIECQAILETAAHNEKNRGPGPGEDKRNFPFELFEGHTASPTALVRTEFFASQQPGTKIFKLLGINYMNAERGGLPLGDTHLVVLVYLVSLVQAWDAKLGVNMSFNPWDAIRVMGWSENNLSRKRLKDAIDRLADTTVRIYHDYDTERQEAAPMVARRVTDMEKEKRSTWEVQLTSTLLEMICGHRTYLKFETLAALPSGCTTLLYAFIASERSKQTEWDMKDLAHLIGLTSSNTSVIKSKLKAALEILVCGSVEVKPRGAAVRKVEGRGVVDFTPSGKIVIRSTTSKTKTFSPPLESYSFRKTLKGNERVMLIKRNA